MALAHPGELWEQPGGRPSPRRPGSRPCLHALSPTNLTFQTRCGRRRLSGPNELILAHICPKTDLVPSGPAKPPLLLERLTCRRKTENRIQPPVPGRLRPPAAVTQHRVAGPTGGRWHPDTHAHAPRPPGHSLNQDPGCPLSTLLGGACLPEVPPLSNQTSPAGLGSAAGQPGTSG